MSLLEEHREKSVEAHKDFLQRIMEQDDKERELQLSQKKQEQSAPYINELEQIIARKNQNGFYTQADAKRAGELIPLLESIENGTFEDTDEGFQRMMAESSQRIIDRQNEIKESRKRAQEGQTW